MSRARRSEPIGMAWHLLLREAMRLVFESLNGLERSLSVQQRRHELLAENVANLTTPGFIPQDVDPRAFEHTLDELQQTHSNHISSPSSASDPAAIEAPDRTPGADGNAVSLELQMAKLNATKIQFALSSSVVSRRLALLRYAASDGNG